jgi:hypothetical protein
MEQENKQTGWDIIVDGDQYLSALARLKRHNVTVEDLASYFEVEERQVRAALRKKMKLPQRDAMWEAIDACEQINKDWEAANGARNKKLFEPVSKTRNDCLALDVAYQTKTVHIDTGAGYFPPRPEDKEIVIKNVSVTLFNGILIKNGITARMFYDLAPKEWIGPCDKNGKSKPVYIDGTVVRCIPLVIFPDDNVAPDRSFWGRPKAPECPSSPDPVQPAQ